jgi:hypothetical protein
MRNEIREQADGSRIVKPILNNNDKNDAHRQKLFNKIDKIADKALNREITIDDALFNLEHLKQVYQTHVDEMNVKIQFVSPEQEKELLEFRQKFSHLFGERR